MSKLVILGVDPAFRTCGYFLGSPVKGSRGGMVHIANGVIDGGNTTAWIHHVDPILGGLEKVVKDTFVPDLVAIEHLVWYGKRKGALALAHLAGTIYGFFKNMGARVVFYPPGKVKERSAAVRITFPTDHERDAFALAKMVYEDYGGDELAT